ncbi:icmt-1 [Symbiodinium necroappetens]|uniref:Icmt-1 protein n=1 Tax=Symbiodinium necroappetens TaxID=1628268 RepID=A0A812QT62_9DINO|nr:icmt-1 [Symbiodinium necroappetens]
MAKCRKACRACTDVNWGLAGDLSLAVLTVLVLQTLRFAHCFYESARQLLLADSHLTSDPPELPFHELSEGPGRRGSVQYAIDSQLELAEPLSAASHTRSELNQAWHCLLPIMAEPFPAGRCYAYTGYCRASKRQKPRRKASESRYKRWVGIALSLRHRLRRPDADGHTAQKALVEKEEGRLQTQRHADVVAARRKNQQLWQASEMGPIEASPGSQALDDWYSDPWASPGIARKSSSSSRQGDRRGPRKTSGGLRGPEVETFCLEQLDDAPTEVADAAPLEDVSDPGGGPSEPQWQYGRCVALKLVAHSPHGNSAFEQLLPVLLTVFQVSDDERKSSFLARRRQQGSSWWSQVLRCTADKPSSEERDALTR